MKKITKPKKQNLERQINDKKLASAQKQFDLENKKNELKQARERFQQVLGVQQKAQELLKAHKDKKDAAKTDLNVKFSGRKIRDPAVRRREVEAEIRELRLELQTGSQNQRGETRLIRQIKALELELENIKKYIENNVQDVFNTFEEHAEKFNEVFKDFSQKRQRTDNASADRKRLKEETDAIDKEKQEISKEIIELAQNKKDLQSEYQRQCRKYEDAVKEATALHQLITHKENRTKQNKNKSAIQKRVAKEAEKRQQEEEQKKAAEEKILAEKRAVSDRKRQKAIEAYNAMQQKLKSRTVTTSAARSVSGSAKKAALVKDPHAAEKDLCRNLIVLCESMVPPARKKKKKNVRLVYRADSFAKFNQVGVKIPKYSKQLAETIKALEQRIVDYDAEPEAEEVTEKEEEEEVQAEEAPAVEAEETVETGI